MKCIARGILSGMILLSAACGLSPEQVARKLADAQTATAAAWTATATETSSTTATLTATITPTRIATSTRKPPTPTFTASRTPTRDIQRYYSPDGFISVILPFKWKEDEIQENFASLKGPIVGRSWLQIVLTQVEYYGSLADFTVDFRNVAKQGVEKYTDLNEAYQRADSGEAYFRWECEIYGNASYHHSVFYFFGRGDWKLVIVYDRLRSQSASYDDRIDAAMRTVLYARPDSVGNAGPSVST
jgi:hypothetical protein